MTRKSGRASSSRRIHMASEGMLFRASHMAVRFRYRHLRAVTMSTAIPSSCTCRAASTTHWCGGQLALARWNASKLPGPCRRCRIDRTSHSVPSISNSTASRSCMSAPISSHLLRRFCCVCRRRIPSRCRTCSQRCFRGMPSNLCTCRARWDRVVRRYRPCPLPLLDVSTLAWSRCRSKSGTTRSGAKLEKKSKAAADFRHRR